MKKRILFIFCVLFNVFLSLAQVKSASGEGVISGRILNKQNDLPIEYASVRLFRTKDSTLVGGVFTDVNGKFSFEAIAIGHYYLKCTFTGFLPRQIDDVQLSKSIHMPPFLGRVG